MQTHARAMKPLTYSRQQILTNKTRILNKHASIYNNKSTRQRCNLFVPGKGRNERDPGYRSHGS